jgi:hypothetical protein
MFKVSDGVISNGKHTANGSNPSLPTLLQKAYNSALFKIKGI